VGSLKLPRDAKPDVARRALPRIRVARRDAIAIAVRVVTEERAAAHRSPAGREPILAPLPDIAANVEEAKAVALARDRFDGLRRPAVVGLIGKPSAPHVATRHPIAQQLVAPRAALA